MTSRLGWVEGAGQRDDRTCPHPARLSRHPALHPTDDPNAPYTLIREGWESPALEAIRQFIQSH